MYCHPGKNTQIGQQCYWTCPVTCSLIKVFPSPLSLEQTKTFTNPHDDKIFVSLQYDVYYGKQDLTTMASTQYEYNHIHMPLK